MVRSLLVTVALLLCGCSPDAGQTPTAFTVSKDSLWHTTCEQSPDARFKACYGPGWGAGKPQDPSRYNFFEISVEEISDDQSTTVIFERRFEAEAIDSSLLNYQIKT